MGKIFFGLVVLVLISCSSNTGEGVSSTSMSVEQDETHETHETHDHDHDHDHDHENSLDVSQLVNPPMVSISGVETETGEVSLNFSVENLELVPVDPPSEHKSGQGHLHLYVDGASIAMLHETTYTVTDLTKGSHSFRITVSTNDHREYSVDGEVIADSISLEIQGGEEVEDSDSQIVVEVEEGTVVGGIQRLKAEIGDQISITVLSDTEDEFHLHAYDLTLLISPNEPATLIFEADIPGVFEGELHDAGYQILSLEVS